MPCESVVKLLCINTYTDFTVFFRYTIVTAAFLLFFSRYLKIDTACTGDIKISSRYLLNYFQLPFHDSQMCLHFQ